MGKGHEGCDTPEVNGQVTVQVREKRSRATRPCTMARRLLAHRARVVQPVVGS